MDWKTSTPASMILLMMISVTQAQRAQVVDTTLGPIQGLRKTVQGKEVDVYYGIPFARPPLGDLRFKRPEPADPWTEVRATVTKPNACFQSIDTAFDRFPGVEMWNPNTPMSEDCLYLNVWVPRGSGSQPSRTTMVWIYGGAFSTGSSSLDVYDGSKLASSQNVIVVSMNYRLGPLGFLYTGNMEAPGNQGLLDQVLALKWIYNNVVHFGGRHDSITIFGESAGSISVGYHLMSALSRDYFTRGIMQSGSPLSDVTIMPQAKAAKRARALAAIFDCPDSSIPEMIQCLRGVSAENVTNTQWRVVTPGVFLDLPLRPVVDGYFLEEDPWTLVARGDVKDTEVLIGANKDEGMYFLVYGYKDLFPLDNSVELSRADLEKVAHALNGKVEEAVDRAVMYEYVDRVVPANRQSYQDIADDIAGDRKFICPTVEFAQTFSSLQGGRHVYLYSFEQRLSNNPWPEWTGVMHGYEIEAVFGLPLQHSYTQQERDLASRMMAYWARFAQTGNPNGDDVVWPKLTSQDALYLRLKGEGDSVGQGMRHEQCSFRDTILPLLKKDSSTEPSECASAGPRNTSSPVLLLLLMFCSMGFPVVIIFLT